MQPEKYVSKFPHKSGGQNEVMDRRPQLDGNNRIAELVRRIVRDGPLDQSLEDINSSPFTPNIRYTRHPSDFKLPTLEMYDEQTDPTFHLIRYIRHIEVLGTSEEVMSRCFLLYLTDLAAIWFRQLKNESIST